MQISSKQKGDTIILKMNGELDHHSAQNVRTTLDNLIETPSIKHMIMDLSGLRFMDSSGIGVFIGRYKVLAKRGGNILVCGLNANITKIFEISGLFKITRAYGSVDEALQSLKGVG